MENFFRRVLDLCRAACPLVTMNLGRRPNRPRLRARDLSCGGG